MEVYYSSSLWSNPRGKAGKLQRLNWRFVYLNQQCIIPYIYRFNQGIVFDMITLVDEKNFKAFFEKYQALEGKDLSSNQREIIEQEHPYQPLSLAKIWINGKKVEDGFSSSSGFYTSDNRDDKLYKVLKSTYEIELKEINCFACQRFCIPYPKEAKRYKRFRRSKRGESIHCLKFITYKKHTFYPLDQVFYLSEDKPTYELELIHPITKVQHRLYFKKEEVVEIPFKDKKAYATSASFDIMPPLEEERFVFDSSLSYQSKPESRYAPQSASSIAIIGGVSGVTTMVIPPKQEKGNCFSKITFKKEDADTFILQGLKIEQSPQLLYEYSHHKG